MSELWIVCKQFEKWHRMHETWILPKYGVMNSLASMRTRGRGRVQFADRADGLALDDYLCDKVGHQVSRIRLHSHSSDYFIYPQ